MRSRENPGGQPWGPQIPATGGATAQTADDQGHDWKGPRTKKERDEAEKKLREASGRPLPTPPQMFEQHSPPRQPPISGASSPQDADDGGHQIKPTENLQALLGWLLRLFR